MNKFLLSGNTGEGIEKWFQDEEITTPEQAWETLEGWQFVLFFLATKGVSLNDLERFVSYLCGDQAPLALFSLFKQKQISEADFLFYLSNLCANDISYKEQEKWIKENICPKW